MFLNSLISIAILVPCLSVPQSYRPPSPGTYDSGLGGFSGKGSSSGGFGLPFAGDERSDGFSSIKGQGAGGQGFSGGFSGEQSFGGQGYNGGLSGGRGSVQGGFDGGLHGGRGAVQGGFDGRSHSGSGAGQGRFEGGNYGGQDIAILKDDREGPIEGNYRFEFETDNGISRYEEGSPNGPYGAVTQQGGWRFTFPDGTPAEFSFVADENGYRVESPLLPTPPPLPPHSIAQIEKAAREAELGIQDGFSAEGQGYSGVSQGGFRGGDALVSQQGYQGSSQEFQGRQGLQGQRSSKQYGY